MGLDVSLHKIDNFKKMEKLTKEYEKKSEAQWEFPGRSGRKYEDLTTAEKDACSLANEKLATSMGLGKWGKYPGDVRVEENSGKYPEHLFKIGYMRSSYNEGGINSLLRRLGMPDLYSIFDVPDGHEYYIKPDWKEARSRAVAVLAAFKAHLSSDMGKYDVKEISFNPFSSPVTAPKSKNEVLQMFSKVLDQRKKCPENDSDFDWYSNRDGQFFMGKPIEVVALIPGTRNLFRNEEPVMYAVYSIADAEDEQGLIWYARALEIVIETIDYVMAQPDANKYYLGWSA